MISNELAMYKALYFDLSVAELRKHYSYTCPNGGYRLIFNFLLCNGFEHAQGSGYHSKYRITDIKVTKLVNLMRERLPWFELCVKKFEVANLTDEFNLMDLLAGDR